MGIISVTTGRSEFNCQGQTPILEYWKESILVDPTISPVVTCNVAFVGRFLYRAQERCPVFLQELKALTGNAAVRLSVHEVEYWLCEENMLFARLLRTGGGGLCMYMA